MDRPPFLTKSIAIRGVDGNDIRVSETTERKEVVVSKPQPKKKKEAM